MDEVFDVIGRAESCAGHSTCEASRRQRQPTENQRRVRTLLYLLEQTLSHITHVHSPTASQLYTRQTFVVYVAKY